jgi:glycine cleavage system H protein
MESRMSTPSDCRVSDTHEWFRVNGNTVTVGITQHAADALTDITYVEMKPSGTVVSAGGVVGEVESVKTTSEIYSVVGGKIVEVNANAAKDPSLLNSDPFGNGWLLKLEVADASAILALPNGAEYDKKHGH